MARGASGAMGLYLFDLSGRRRAAEGLRRALPELGESERRLLVRQSYVRTRRSRRAEARAVRLDPVAFCRRLHFEGWEHLHNTADGRLFLLGPLGSVRVASRVLELYHEGCEYAVVLPPSPDQETLEAALFRHSVRCSAQAANRALAAGVPAVWVLALPEPGGRWSVNFLPPVPPAANDTAASLTEHYLSVLEERVRRRPDCWPWRSIG